MPDAIPPYCQALSDRYTFERELGRGGMANVWLAREKRHDRRVAVKFLRPELAPAMGQERFVREIRYAANLSHPNILPLKNASFIDNHLVIVFALGEETLADRLRRRLATETAFQFAEQMLEAVAYAHDRRIIHCDIKPENMILFANNRLRLTDFGIARVALRTLRASGSGTVGYIAPEQAVGRPSLRSDVFSLGLIIYRMLSGYLPDWPYRWPPEGIQRLRRKLHPDMIKWLRKSIDPSPRKRFEDARQMLNAYQRLKPRARPLMPLALRVARPS